QFVIRSTRNWKGEYQGIETGSVTSSGAAPPLSLSPVTAAAGSHSETKTQLRILEASVTIIYRRTAKGGDRILTCWFDDKLLQILIETIRRLYQLD
ncbi:Uncharacterized protein DAT39_023487, partial [Clarias magur]